jgi:hypothetical protein
VHKKRIAIPVMSIAIVAIIIFFLDNIYVLFFYDKAETFTVYIAYRYFRVAFKVFA